MILDICGPIGLRFHSKMHKLWGSSGKLWRAFGDSGRLW